MTPTSPTKLGIAINLREYEQLAERYVQECYPAEEQLLEKVRLSRFIVWLQRESARDGNNLLTFRIEKGAENAANEGR